MAEYHLPRPEEREWLLDRLAELTRGCGLTSFLTSPIVLPGERFFPDPFAGDLASAYVLGRRLLDYAGLTAYRLDLREFSDPAQDGDGPLSDGSAERRRTLAVYTGHDLSTIGIGVEWEATRDGPRLLGSLCHEVAHAWRDIHRVVVADRDEEELLTDLTTVVLGFGVPAANAAFLFSSSEVRGAMVYSQWTRSQAGYLPPQAFTFLLAAQAVVRGLGRRERRDIERHLGANQEAFFRTAFEHHIERSGRLLIDLGIPSRPSWPEPQSLEHTARPVAVPDDVVRAGETAAEPPTRETDWNSSGTVFRVAHSWRLWHALTGMFLGGLLGLVAVSRPDPLAWPLFVFPFIGTALGIAVGYGGRYDACSEPSCRTKLSETAASCPGCGGQIRGRLRHECDRLRAAEELDGPPAELETGGAPTTEANLAGGEAGHHPRGLRRKPKAGSGMV